MEYILDLLQRQPGILQLQDSSYLPSLGDSHKQSWRNRTSLPPRLETQLVVFKFAWISALCSEGPEQGYRHTKECECTPSPADDTPSSNVLSHKRILNGRERQASSAHDKDLFQRVLYGIFWMIYWRLLDFRIGSGHSQARQNSRETTEGVSNGQYNTIV